ncbi:MAG: hypothetical protein ACPG6B_07995 [Oceanihabitans sp.]
MIKNTILFLLLICFIKPVFSQSSINDYKYVQVPEKFDFLKEKNKYRLNELTKYLFEKNGFTAFLESETLPNDALANACLILKADVLKEKGMFKTKLKVQLTNCKNEIIYVSAIGESFEKQYKVAYNNALRAAFNSFSKLEYAYKENNNILALGDNEVQETAAELKQLKKEIKELKAEKEAKIAKKEKEAKAVKVVKEEKVDKEEKVVKKPVITNSSSSVNKDKLKKGYTTKEVFNGFQVLDNNLNIVMTIYVSGVKNVFIVKGKDAIIYKKGGNWIYSETNDKELLTKIIDIKF